MITIIFRVKAREGKEDEARAMIEEMAASVEAQEPNTLAYIFHHVQDDPSEFVLFEVYPDDATLQSHMGTPHMAKMREASEVFEPGSAKAERLERIAGFARSAA